MNELDALETGYRIDLFGSTANIIAERVMEGESIDAILKELHDAAEVIVNGQEEGEYIAKKEER